MKNIPQSRRYFSLQYFYLLSEQGYLYHLFDPLPFIQKGSVPCGPAYLRNEKFLDFFFKNLHPTPPNLPHSKLFPFVSRCGKEGNFLAVPGVFSPVVFTDAISPTSDEKYDESSDHSATTANSTTSSRTLKFAGNLTTELDPSLLREWEGRLYHPVGQGNIRGLISSSDEAIKPRRKFLNGNELGEKELEEIKTKVSSECVDPFKVEEELTLFNEGKYAASNMFYESISNTKTTKDLGLVSSSVAFDIGFNFIKDDEDEKPEKSDAAPRYVISLDGGVTEIPVKPLW